MGIEQQTEFIESFTSLLKSGTYSDLQITCGEDTYRVHKAVVCPRSEFFTAACRNFKEAGEGIINLPDDEPQIVKHMVHYLYTLNYPAFHSAERKQEQQEQRATTPVQPISGDQWGAAVRSPRPAVKTKKDKKAGTYPYGYINQRYNDLEEPSSAVDAHDPIITKSARMSPLTEHAKVYALAEKYHIAGLKSLARTYFQAATSTDWNTADFAAAIHVVYTTTIAEDTGLREIVISALQQHTSLVDKPEVEATLRELNGLSFDLLKRTWVGQQNSRSDNY